MSIPEQYFRVLFEDFPSSLFSAGLSMLKRIENKTFCFSFLCQLTSMESVRTFDVPKRAMRSKTRKSDRSITTTMAQVLMSAKKVSEIQIFILGILTGFLGFLEKIRADNTPYHTVSHLWRYTTNCL